MKNLFKIALCQMMVAGDKEQNHGRAAALVEEAVLGDAQVVCLPEIWNGPYDLKLFGGFAEQEDGPTAALLSGLAGRLGIYLIGGSIPERDGDAVYNTSLVFGPTGSLIAKHRKVHLFDIDVENGIRFKESDFFSAGDSFTVFDTDFGKMGVAICFDLRFPGMFQKMAKAGATLVFLPASFNMTTGHAHWDILLKSRALDNQIYMAACAAARNPKASYTSWGHSCVLTPWGEFCAATDAREAIVYADIDLEYMRKVRNEIPLGNQPAD